MELLVEAARERLPRRLAMLGPDVSGYEPQRRGQHRRVIRIAKNRQDVGNEIDRQNEIGERAEERGFHLDRRGAVEGAVIGGEEIFGERQTSRDALGLAPEPAPHPRLVAGSLPRSALVKPFPGGGVIDRHVPSPKYRRQSLLKMAIAACRRKAPLRPRRAGSSPRLA